MPTLLLVDGHSQAYRAFFGLKTPLTTRTGEPVTAVYGFARKLFSVLREYKPDGVAVAFDLGDTWRHAEFKEYKATRDRMPDEMPSQIERIVEVLHAFQIPVLTYPNYEADDILGTLARQAADAGDDVLILTGDRDMFQLVDDHIRILYTSGGPNPVTSVVGREQINERYGLTPEQFVDYKALLGDNSDNIPGVPSVGEKTAIKLMQEYGSVENIYAHLADLTPRLRQALTDSVDQVERNRRLCRIVTDIDNLLYDAAACRIAEYDRSAVVALFTELEFRSLIRELPETTSAKSGPAEASPLEAKESVHREGESGQLALFAADNDEPRLVHVDPTIDSPYLVVDSAESLGTLVAALEGATDLSFDVETTSTNAMSARLVGLGVAWGKGQAAYIPVSHSAGTQLPWDDVKATLQPFFADGVRAKLAHNSKYDLTVLLEHGMYVAGPIHDTMVLAFLLDPASRMLGLKAQAALELGWEMTELTSLIGTGRKQITIDEVPIKATSAYCGGDVDATIQLYPILSQRVREQGMWPLYERVEQPLIPVLTDMERTGVLLDIAFLRHMSKRLSERLGELETELFALVGHEFNLRSTQQLSQVLFGELAFAVPRNERKMASGQYSTAVHVLEQLQPANQRQSRALEIIFEQRQLEKLRGTYVDVLPELVNPRTGRVHTSFNQAGAVTGRMSSSDPNLQNIPIRTEIGREIRRAFIAPSGWTLLSADYSQIELRVLAHVAGDESFIAAFRADEDIHAATASRLYHVPLSEVTKEQRGHGKTINFATVYGSSAFGISSRTDMDANQARQFLDTFFETHPRIMAYIKETERKAQTEGYVETLLGRKRFFMELVRGTLPRNQQGALLRQAINAPIQGSAADIMKIAMTNLHAAIKERGLRARMLLQVHDELVLETPDEERAEIVALVRDIMESAYPLDVPLRVDVEIGPNWYDLEPA